MNNVERIAALTPEQREMLSQRLRERAQHGSAAAPASLPPELPAIPDGPFDPHQPSPLSDIQETFWMGGSGLFDLGGCSANIFIEYEVDGVAGEVAGRLNPVLARAIARHPMLRTVVSVDGMQRVLPEVPPYEVELVNLSLLPDVEIERHLERTRERLRYARHRSDRWPLFDMVVFQLPGERVRYQARFDALIVDGPARTQLVDELVRGVVNEQEGRPRQSDPPAPAISYFDYVRAVQAFRRSAAWERCRAYWHARLPALPPPPRLPLARDFGPETVPRIVKRTPIVLDPPMWAALCRQAARRGITPSGIGTAMIAETLRLWSDEPGFTLGLSGTYCPPIHPQVRQVIGTFANLCLLEVEGDSGPFAARARRLQDRLTADLDHQHYSGHEALREMSRIRHAGSRALLPIQLTSILRSGAGEPPPETEPAEEPEHREHELRQIDLMIAMPQVLIFWVLAESSDRSLLLISQAVEEVFPPGLVNDLIEGYRSLAVRLAEDEAAWSEPRPLRLPMAAAAAPGLPEGAGSGRDGVEAAGRELVRLAELGPADHLLALSPPGSSLALCEALAARGSGAALVVPVERTPEALAALAAREQVTVWSSTPAVLEAVLHCFERSRIPAPRNLRQVLLHRDPIPLGLPERLRALGSAARLIATWGTESAPIAAAGPVGEADAAEATGGGPPLRAVAGWHLHVLDRDLTPRPAWVPGNLFLAAGPAGELQPTGERARRLPDGRVELIGDEPPPQAEALGYGAEPRRVEAILQGHPDVRHAVVAWRSAEQRLAAWILLRAGAPTPDGELRAYLKARLPEHLIPAVFIRLDQLPLTPEGRVDRSALAVPAATEERAATEWSPLATELARLWEEILGRRPASPGDDFFELGGNSLLATRLMGRLTERFGLEQPLPSFLQQPTLACLTELLSRARTERPARTEGAETPAARSPIQRLGDSLRAFKAWLFPPPTSPAHGMRLYLLLWFGQFISGIGTGLGSFALGVWVYRQTASVTQYAMMGFVATATVLLVGPLAGVLADRWDRRRLILCGDFGAMVMTSLMALALYTGQMRIWHVYIVIVVMVSCSALQGPALTASSSMLVSRRQLGRVGGMTQAAAIATGILCPPLSGVLVPKIGYYGVILIDISTFLFSFLVVFFIRLPRPAATAHRERRSFLSDLLFGWSYLRQRPGLLGLLSLFAVTNFALSSVQVLLTPLILSFGSAANLGIVNSAAAAGGLLGSLALSLWGGPRNRVNGILLFLFLQAPILLLGALRPSVTLIATSAFVFMALSPFVGGLSQAIWQMKVAFGIQGRVFAMRDFIVSSTPPLAFLLAGPLADRLFEPLMAPGGLLAQSVGHLIGVGKGRGVGLLFIALGLFIMLVVVLSSLNPRLRKIESELPDASASETAHDGHPPELQVQGA